MRYYYVDLATQAMQISYVNTLLSALGHFFSRTLESWESLKTRLALSKFSIWKSREGRRHPQAGDLQAINEI